MRLLEEEEKDEKEWLNSITIDQYFQLLSLDHKCKFISSTVFTSEITDTRELKRKYYKEIQRQLEEGEIDYIFAPRITGEEKDHWILLIFQRKQEVVYFDPYSQKRNPREFNSVYQSIDVDPTKESLICCLEKNVQPFQDQHSCGVWICLFASVLLKNGKEAVKNSSQLSKLKRTLPQFRRDIIFKCKEAMGDENKCILQRVIEKKDENKRI